MTSQTNRKPIAALIVSAALLVGVAVHEGYVETATPPVRGDRCTDGFGNTIAVKCGDKTNPVRSLVLLENDLDKRKAAMAKCVHVPLSQNELDAYESLSYNIGIAQFCGSTLVKELNQQHYAQACEQILVWDKFHGRMLEGLKTRRQQEYRTCIGDWHVLP